MPPSKKTSRQKNGRKTSSSRRASGSKRATVVVRVPRGAKSPRERSLGPKQPVSRGYAATATALDKFVLGLYSPEADSRGPCLVPQNTFRTTHRFNTVVSNVNAALGVTYSDMYLAIGDFWAASPPNYTAYIATSDWESQVNAGFGTHVGLLVARTNGTGAQIGVSFGESGTSAAEANAAVPCANGTTIQTDGRFGNAAWWDSDPTVVSSAPGIAPLNCQPRRVVGLKVVVIPTTNALALQGSIRGGDNGTVAMSARLAPSSGTNATGTSNPGVVSDVYDSVWPDAYTGTTQFTRDPRIRELGSLEHGQAYEFVWVPTSEDAIQYEDEANAGSWTWQAASSFTTGYVQKSALPVNFLRRGPAVLIGLNGLSTSSANTFQIRATIAYEHVVTPYGNGAVYDYSRKAPWFPLPWDRMSELPTAGVGVAQALIQAGRALDAPATGMTVGPQPNLTRALLGEAGVVKPAVYGYGTTNPNGAPAIVGTGAEIAIAGHIARETSPSTWSKIERFGSNVFNKSAAAFRYGVDHADKLEKLFDLFSKGGKGAQNAGSAARAAENLLEWGPRVVEVL